MHERWNRIAEFASFALCAGLAVLGILALAKSEYRDGALGFALSAFWLMFAFNRRAGAPGGQRVEGQRL